LNISRGKLDYLWTQGLLHRGAAVDKTWVRMIFPYTLYQVLVLEYSWDTWTTKQAVKTSKARIQMWAGKKLHGQQAS